MIYYLKARAAPDCAIRLARTCRGAGTKLLLPDRAPSDVPQSAPDVLPNDAAGLLQWRWNQWPL